MGHRMARGTVFSSIAGGGLLIGIVSWLAGTAPAAGVQRQSPGSNPPPLDYSLTADSQPQPGVSTGSLTTHVLAPGKIFPDTPHNYQVYVPASYDRDRYIP